LVHVRGVRRAVVVKENELGHHPGRLAMRLARAWRMALAFSRISSSRASASPPSNRLRYTRAWPRSGVTFTVLMPGASPPPNRWGKSRCSTEANSCWSRLAIFCCRLLSIVSSKGKFIVLRFGLLVVSGCTLPVCSPRREPTCRTTFNLCR
jgi:hypothetical protein